MLQKIKVLSYRLIHPLYWSKGLIGFILAFQLIGLIIWSGYFFFQARKPDKTYVEGLLESRRLFIKNLKLANLEAYIWRPTLRCESLSSQSKKKKKTKISFFTEPNLCLPLDLKFSRKDSKKPAESYYIKKSKRSNKSKGKIKKKSKSWAANKIYYHEKIERACLICHRNKSKNTWIEWSYTPKRSILNHISEEKAGMQEGLIKKAAVYILAIFLFWLFYTIIRFLKRKTGSLDVVAFSLLSDEPRKPVSFFKSIGLVRRKFIYAEAGIYFLRGYLPRKYFLTWFQKIKKMKKMKRKETFLHFKIGITQASQGVGLEEIRFAHAISNRTGSGRILLEQVILSGPEQGVLKQEKKVVWKLLQKNEVNEVEERKLQFVDLELADNEKE